ncbi:MAG: nicotinate-nucleotide adenylyltransferase [Thermomicrobiales bacterium]
MVMFGSAVNPEWCVVQERVGVFGGTFDPIHIGHLIIAEECRYALRLDRVVFVPANSPPHKPEMSISPGRDRLAMIALAIADRPHLEADSLEFSRPGPSFTKDTLGELARRTPSAALFFLMGEDSLRDFATWRNPERILELAELAVARRPRVAVDLSALFAKIPAAVGRTHFVGMPQIGISSSSIRSRVRIGAPIAFQVPPAVERYIRDARLYLPNAKGADDEPDSGLPARTPDV